MTATEIIEQAALLPPHERLEIARRIEDTVADDDFPMTDEQKAELDRRIEDMELHPERSIPWEEARARIAAWRPHKA